MANSITDKAIEQFAQMMVEKMETLSADWEMPWFSSKGNGVPQNLSGRPYSRLNELFLFFLCEKHQYQTPVFLTFLQAKNEGITINKGAKSFPVLFYNFIVTDITTGEKIPFDEYIKLSKDEREDYLVKPFLKLYNVFNLDQTSFAVQFPERFDALLNHFKVPEFIDDSGMTACKELDLMLSEKSWLCPIHVEKRDNAFFSPSLDKIHIPLKAQFKSGEGFYSTLLHEMTHSTGTDDRLDRKFGKFFGDDNYGREELVAELTAALMCRELGLNSSITRNNAAYLKGWIENIREEPKFLFSVLSDVGKAAAMIDEKIQSQSKDLVLNIENEQTEEQGAMLSTKQSYEIENEQTLIKSLHTPLYKLSGKEFSYVERVFTEKTHFSFTGPEVIKSSDDVAYIFKELENSAVENSFAVYVKNGQAIVQHLGMGGFVETSINAPAMIEAFNRINPDKVYFVHNHPSGQLNASQQDKLIYDKLKQVFGSKLELAIIINLTSGKYGIFDEYTFLTVNKDIITGDFPIKVFAFDKQVFDKDYNPEILETIRSEKEIAAFISGHRLGKREKISFLILSNGMKVVGNIFTPYTQISPDNVIDISKFITSCVTTYGGNGCVIYGRFPFENIEILNKKITENSCNGIKLIDVIKVKESGEFKSAYSLGLMEPELEYPKSRNEIFENNKSGNFATKQINYDFMKIDEQNVNWEQLNENYGITREALTEAGVLDEILNGRKSSKLVELTYQTQHGPRPFDAKVRLQEKDGVVGLVYYPVRQAPDLERPYYGYEFTEEDKKNLLETGNLGHTAEIERNGEKVGVFISVDSLTNDLVHIDVARLKMPNEIKGVKLTEQQISLLSEGKPVHVKNMTSNAGNTFSSYVMVNAEKRSLEFVQIKPNIVENINEMTSLNGALISEEERKILSEGGSVFIEGMTARDGRTYSANIKYDPETKKIKYDFPENDNSKNQEFKMPDRIKGVVLTDEQKAKMEAGEKVFIKDMTAQSGKKFSNFVYIDRTEGKIKFVPFTPQEVKDVKESKTQLSKPVIKKKNDQSNDSKKKGKGVKM